MIKQIFIGFIMCCFAPIIAQISDTGQVFTIPVVVHVVYNTTNQNISDAQIASQLRVLNEDYRRLNSDRSSTPSAFLSVAADAQIAFQLANYDTEGNATSGITRTATSNIQFFNDNITNTTKGGATTWGKNYLNIWVGNLPSGIAGWTNNHTTDSTIQGVVIDFENFGTVGAAKSPYHLGRTATHEIGHWLGLQHLEGTGGNCSSDDGIEDTPNQEHSISGNTTASTTCGSVDMTTNYMQLVDDELMNLFTEGQKNVMRTTLVEQHQALLQNFNRTVSLSPNNRTIAAFDVFPNPLIGSTFQISAALPFMGSFKIFNLQGNSVSTNIKQTNRTTFELEDALYPGTYLLVYTTSDHTYQTKLNISF